MRAHDGLPWSLVLASGLLVLPGIAAGVAAASPTVQGPPGEREQLEAQDPAGELERLSREWMQAMSDGDGEALESLMAEEFRLARIGAPGPPMDRATWIDNALSAAGWEHRGFEHVGVRRFGDVAVMSARMDFEIDDGSWRPAVSTSAPVVDVWVRRAGRWQVAARFTGPWEVERWFDRVYGFLGGVMLMSVLWILVRRRAAAG